MIGVLDGPTTSELMFANIEAPVAVMRRSKSPDHREDRVTVHLVLDIGE